MISQFHCGDKQFGNSYVRVCVVSNCTMGLFWITSFIGYYENEFAALFFQSVNEILWCDHETL